MGSRGRAPRRCAGGAAGVLPPAAEIAGDGVAGLAGAAAAAGGRAGRPVPAAAAAEAPAAGSPLCTG